MHNRNTTTSHSVRGQWRDRDSSARDARCVMKQHNSRFVRSCASPPLLCNYRHRQPKRVSDSAAHSHILQHTAAHSTATHSNTHYDLPTHTLTYKHTAPQLHTTAHATNTTAHTDKHTLVARHCIPAHDRCQQRRAQQHRTNNTCTTVLQSLSAHIAVVAHHNCGMHDQSTCVALVRTMYWQQPPPTRARHHSRTAKRW
jgi:hypothetical protein